MPGMGDLQAMLAKMGMGHMMPGGAGGGGAKVNVSAMKANLDRNLKAAKNKERLLAKLETRKQTQTQSQTQTASLNSIGVDAQGRESLVFSKGEQVERSVRPSASVAGPSTETTTSKTSGAAKKKKNKNKTKPQEETSE